jgi:hypothetical protein
VATRFNIIDNIFFCQNPVENCTQIFLRFDVNRDKSDVMTTFGMIDRSDVFRVFRQAGSALSGGNFPGGNCRRVQIILRSAQNINEPFRKATLSSIHYAPEAMVIRYFAPIFYFSSYGNGRREGSIYFLHLAASSKDLIDKYSD